MIDSHCHLSRLVERGVSFSQIRERAAAISKVISCSCSVHDWEAEESFGRAWPEVVVPQFGIHPWWAAEERPANWLELLRLKLEANLRCGIGEIGLHKNKPGVSMSAQTDMFRVQLNLACEMNRVCSIHCVNAFGTLLAILREGRGGTLVMHSFSGSTEVMRDLTRLAGYQVFFSASAQCPKESVLREIPIDFLLIETDSPDQQFTQGGELHTDVSLLSGNGGELHTDVPPMHVNDCSQLPLVARRVAAVVERPVCEILAITTANARRAFSLV